MKTTLLLLILALFSPVYAGGGQALHDAACVQCHSSLTAGNPTNLYTRLDRKVSDIDSLAKRVKGCAVAADVDWSDQQRAAVVQYLAKQFYHF
jgi:mono/diheme cytochrome c family protein